TAVTFGGFTTQNTGDQRTSTGFLYGFYLSSSPQIDPATSILLRSAVVGQNIEPRASILLTGDIATIPPTVAPGTYYLGLRINSGDPATQPHIFEPEGNDSFTIPIQIVPGANLVIQQMSLAPATMFAGQTTTATATIVNA